MNPSWIEITWTLFSMIILVVSLSEFLVSRRDYERKVAEAAERNGDAEVARKLAKLLSYTVGLDTLILFLWTMAGALSIIRHYITALYDQAQGLLVIMLYLALLSFGARVLVRMYSRRVINKM